MEEGVEVRRLGRSRPVLRNVLTDQLFLPHSTQIGAFSCGRRSRRVVGDRRRIGHVDHLLFLWLRPAAYRATRWAAAAASLLLGADKTTGGGEGAGCISLSCSTAALVALMAACRVGR